MPLYAVLLTDVAILPQVKSIDANFFHFVKIIEDGAGALTDAEEGVFRGIHFERGFFFYQLVQPPDKPASAS